MYYGDDERRNSTLRELERKGYDVDYETGTYSDKDGYGNRGGWVDDDGHMNADM